MSIGELGNGVRQYFYTKPDKWLWKEGLIIFGKVMIDVMYVEEFMRQHKDYDEDESIQENIIRIYGKDAADFVERGIA